MNKVYKDKAGQVVLNDLHAQVAEHLGKNLDDVKVLGQAIAFLKNNNITADVVDSSEVVSLKESITSIAKREKEKSLSVEDLMAIVEGD